LLSYVYILLFTNNDVIPRLSNILPVKTFYSTEITVHCSMPQTQTSHFTIHSFHMRIISLFLPRFTKLNGLFKNHFTYFQRPFYKSLRTSISIKIHCITPVQNHCNNVFFVLKLAISVSLEIGLILRLKVFILVRGFLCSYIRVCKNCATHYGKKKCILF